MKYIQKLFTSRDNGAEADSYVGQTGRIWWDPVTNSFYYSDGVTPGGFQIGGGAAGNPAGLNTQIQYNNNNVFGASASFTYDNSTQTAVVTNFTSTGNVNFSTTSNVSLGTVANIHIAGGTPNQVLTTDGSGNLTWEAPGAVTPPSGGNTQIQYNNNNAFGSEASFTYDQATHTASVTNLLTTGNVNFVSTANVGLGSVANIHITGGASNQVLTTDGSGNLTWSAAGGSTPPAGNNTQLQFNNAGSFGSSANLSFNSATNILNLAGSLVTNNIQMGDGLAKFCYMSVFSATTISTTPHQLLWSVPAAEVAAVDFVILSTNLTDNSRQTSKITSMILGTTVVFNEYSGLQINGGVGTFYVEYVPGPTPLLILSVTPDSSTLTTYDTMITQYRAI